MNNIPRLPGFVIPREPSPVVPSVPVPVEIPRAFGAVSTKALPLSLFDGDIVIPANSAVSINVRERLGDRCTGFILVSVIPGVQVSINGGGWRTVAQDQAMTDAQVKTLNIKTDAAGSCILQIHGV